MKRYSFGLLAVVFLTSPVQADMEKADTDHDGKVSRAEFISQKENSFKSYDKNSDGTLDRDEWQTMTEHKEQGQEKRSSYQGSQQSGQQRGRMGDEERKK